MLVIFILSYLLFQNTNPERGRKPVTAASMSASSDDFRTQTPKGDGNCQQNCWHTLRLLEHFRTQTPKGDGNFPEIISYFQSSDNISEHKPRKGTETGFELVVVRVPPRDISEHKPRKGTETEQTHTRYQILDN